jgi:hypothetical protein
MSNKSTKKPSRGRPRNPYPERYQIRHTASQMKAWAKSAGIDLPLNPTNGGVFQDWIRAALDAKASEP